MPLPKLSSSPSPFVDSLRQDYLTSRLDEIKRSLCQGNPDQAVVLLHNLSNDLAERDAAGIPASSSPHAMDAEILRLRAQLTASKEQLDTIIATHRINAHCFSRLDLAIKTLHETQDFKQLPAIVKKIAQQIDTDGIHLFLDETTYADFVPKGIEILSQETLNDINDWITGTNDRPIFLGPLEDMKRWDMVHTTITDNAASEGSCFVYPFFERASQDHLAGLICLHDKTLDRYTPHKATDYLEHFCYILGCTISMLRVHKYLERERFTDPLTGIPNRAYLMAYGQQILEFADRKSFPVTLVFIDLNGFKAVNDNYGHQAGDDILKQVATCLKNLVRKYDMVVRLSGDEFVVLLPGVAKTRTGQLISRMAACIAEICPDNTPSPANISASIGVAGFQQGQSIQELMARADRAMYAHKRQCTR